MKKPNNRFNLTMAFGKQSAKRKEQIARQFAIAS